MSITVNEYEMKDLIIGCTESFDHEISIEMEDLFRILSGDINTLHYDDEYATGIRGDGFKQHVSFGMLTASLYSTLVGVYLPGKYSLIHSIDIKFLKPVYAGDWLTVSGTIIDKSDELKLIVIRAQIINQNDQCVSKSNIKVLLLK